MTINKPSSIQGETLAHSVDSKSKADDKIKAEQELPKDTCVEGKKQKSIQFEGQDPAGISAGLSEEERFRRLDVFSKLPPPPGWKQAHDDPNKPIPVSVYGWADYFFGDLEDDKQRK